MEVRFSRPSIWSMDSCSGKSADDRVIFDRIYVHRAGSFLWDSSGNCSNDGYWNCSSHTWERPWRGVHGIDVGSIYSSASVDHILIQNSVIEVTGDGVRFTGAGTDKIIRNNTFGASHDPESALEVIWLGTTGASWGAQVYNNAFFCDKSSCAGGIKYNGTRNITADYNAYMYPYTSYSGSPRVWEEGDTLEVVRSSYGQESHGFVVCSSGCNGSQGRYYNDGNGSHRFVDPRVDDGSASNYTPLSTSRLVNAGLNSQCPTEDFYGNARSDGACDIGAVEYRGGSPDTSPPSPVTNFNAAPGDRQVSLTWNHSASTDNRGTQIRFKTTGYPTGSTDGTVACDRTGNPGAADSCVHGGLTNGTTYYYSAFSYDGAGNYGTAVNDSAAPAGPSNTPPDDVQNNRRTDTR